VLHSVARRIYSIEPMPAATEICRDLSR